MPFKRILIAIDSGEISTHAACAGLELAGALGAEVAFVHVIEPALSDASSIAVQAGERMETDDDELAQVLAGLRGRAVIPPGVARFIRVGGMPGAAITLKRLGNGQLISSSSEAMVALVSGASWSAASRRASRSIRPARCWSSVAKLEPPSYRPA